MTNIQQKRGTSTDLATVNPVLLAGEICVETDTNKFKIGDGTTAYNSLNYQGGSSITVDQTYDGTSANAQSGVAINGAGFLQNNSTATSSLFVISSDSSSGQYNTVINGGSSTTGDRNVAIGTWANAKGNAVAIGVSASANANSISIGSGATTTYSASQYGARSIVIGKGANAYYNACIVLGYGSSSKGISSVIAGENAGGKEGCVVIGHEARARHATYYTDSDFYNYCTVIGYQAKGRSAEATAIGYQADCSAQRGLALGHSASCSGSYGTAIGQGATVSAQYAIQLGSGTNSTAGTFSVGLSGTNYQLLDASGKIPNARLNSTVLLTSTGVSSTDIRTITKLTQAEYDALVQGGTVDANTFYVIVAAASS